MCRAPPAALGIKAISAGEPDLVRVIHGYLMELA
jgi:hypothetical protein